MDSFSCSPLYKYLLLYWEKLKRLQENPEYAEMQHGDVILTLQRCHVFFWGGGGLFVFCFLFFCFSFSIFPVGWYGMNDLMGKKDERKISTTKPILTII